MKKDLTYLCGYYGMKNTGDDALLLATAWGSEYLLGKNRFVVSTPRALDLPGLPLIKSTLASEQKVKGENRLRLYSNALVSSRVIFGGGSVLHNSHDINQKRHLIKLANRRNALALGIGVGPFKDVKAEKACRHFLNECQYVGLRDKESYEMAACIAPEANIHLTFDLAPLLLLNDYYHSPQFERRGICVCLCPMERLHGDKYSETPRLVAMAKSLREIYKQTGEPITLLDFNGHSFYGDTSVHQELSLLLGDDIPVKHIAYHHNPLVVLQMMGSFKLVVGMRLHASILAFLAGTPVVSLNYHSKCAGWCEQIGLPGSLQFNTDRIDDLQLTQVISNGLQHGFPAVELSVQQAIKKSLLNWRIYNEKPETNIRRRYSFV